jgi:trypsin
MAKLLFVLALCLVCVAAGPFNMKIKRKDQATTGRRIVGGEEAGPNEFPFIMDMYRYGGHYCGGALIAPSWVLTACHCSQGGEDEYVLTAGEHDEDIFEGPEQRREVEAIFRHPKYNPSNYSHDVALMKLKVPVELNDIVKLVELPPAGFDPTGNSELAGWGALTEGGSSPTTVYKVSVPLVPNDQCKAMYEDGSSYSIDDSMICAGEAGKDSCQGDSGGPMLCDSEGTQVHCGVVSWGIGCAREGFPGVYARTSFFLDWIAETIEQNS